jgi:hypothetical protein
MAVLAALMIARRRFRLRSPWHPLLLAGFTASSLAAAYTVTVNPAVFLLVLGYAYRFFIFFLIIVVVAALRSITGARRDRWIIFAMFIVFAVNGAFVVAQRLRGETAVYTNSSNGVQITMYGSGLFGEQNPLSSGLFFVFVLVVLGALLRTRSLKLVAYLPCALSCVLSLVFITNRSAFASAAAVLIATIWSYLPNWQVRALVLAPAISAVVLGAVRASDYVRLDLSSLHQAALIRIELWAMSWDRLMQSPLTGWGLGIWSEPHQAYLRILGEFGLLAGTALLAMFTSMIVTRVPSGKPRLGQARVRGTGQADWSWAFRVFLLGLLVGGLLTDALTPVLPWQLLAFLGGLSWGAWSPSRSGRAGGVNLDLTSLKPSVPLLESGEEPPR